MGCICRFLSCIMC